MTKVNANEFLGVGVRPVVELKPPGSEKTLRLRYPTFAEWYRLTSDHRKCGEGNEPPLELVARTIGACLANESGERAFTDEEAAAFLDADPKTVLWLYVKCVETVMKNDDQAVGEVEKN